MLSFEGKSKRVLESKLDILSSEAFKIKFESSLEMQSSKLASPFTQGLDLLKFC